MYGDLKGCDDLENLSDRAAVAALIHARCGWLRAQGEQYQREFWRDLNRARLLDPRSRNIALHYREVMQLIEEQRLERIEALNHPLSGSVPSWNPNPQPPNPEPVIPIPQAPMPDLGVPVFSQ